MLFVVRCALCVVRCELFVTVVRCLFYVLLFVLCVVVCCLSCLLLFVVYCCRAMRVLCDVWFSVCALCVLRCCCLVVYVA